jgi:E3 ubiquitin-protein ligase HERC2
MIFKIKNLRIAHIFSGWEHNILLADNGDIYSFGNNQQYQCGLSNKDNINKIITSPTNISILNNNIKGISAACGNEYTLILSKDNEVYAFGNNEDGVLGISDNKLKKYEFTKINFGIYTNKIKEISAGTVHNLAITQDNKLFSWGSSQGGQLGLPEKYLISQPNYQTSFFLSSPNQISIFSKSKKPENIIKISCGEAHSLALTNNGTVYSWGFGSNGQLGLGFCEDSFEPGTGLTKSRIFTPHLVKGLDDEKIIDIKCGKTFSMFINDKNELFACGVNDLNQLGINEPFSKEHLHNKETPCYDFVIPIKVDCFLNMKVLKVSCGEGHCLAVIKDLISNIITIWSWGNNKFGQLGQGSLVKKSTPNPINFLSDYNSKNFDEISCGGFHSLCLIKYRENLKWIEDDFKKIQNIIDEIGLI